MTADEFLTSVPKSSDDQEGMQQRDALDSVNSLADYAAATASDPEAVGQTLRVFADRGFTGEAVLELAAVPGAVVRIHLDAGRPYVAERVGDEPIGRRLVAAGTIEAEQLQRGMVPVGDVEHLGRLFQRERTIDRDAVVAAVEAMTDELLTEVADDRATVTITPYRHHRSGIHRWFVGPQATPSPFDSADPASRTPDAPEVADRVAPPPDGAAFDAPEPTDLGGDDLTVEWSEPISAFDAPVVAPLDTDGDAAPPLIVALPEPPAAAAAFGSPPQGPAIQLAPPVALARVLDDAPGTHDVADGAAGQIGGDEENGVDADGDGFDDEFTMVWPDGSQVGLDDAGAASTEPEPTTSGEASMSTASSTADVAEPLLPKLDLDRSSQAPTEVTAPGDDDLPEDVAEAVRRALAAIERAATDPAVPARLGGAAVDLPSLNLEPIGDDDAAGVATAQPTSFTDPVPTASNVVPVDDALDAAPAPQTAASSAQHSDEPPTPAAPSMAFAPPTADMSAEAVYERAAAQRAATKPGQASVVFVDGDEADGAKERTSALKRLIGSLRKGR